MDSVISKIDAFIRKYYKNRLIKGAIIAVALLVSLFLVVVLLEYFGYFSTTVRTVLFWLFIVALGSITAFYVVVPLLKMYKLGSRISYQQAARIIGSHFPDVEDKLLNLLQLQEQATASNSDGNALLLASIEQKTSLLSPIPFANAVDLRSNRRYLKLALPPLALLLLAAVLFPSFISEPSRRIINHNTYYQRPAPFSFVVDNPSLQAAQHDDFTLQVHVEGSSIPAEVYLSIDGTPFRMTPSSKTHHSYTLRNLQRSCQLQLQAAGVQSPVYSLTVLPKPAVVDFQTVLTYPAYTHKAQEVLQADGNLTVPEGTQVQWIMHTRDVDTLHFAVADRQALLTPASNGRITHTHRAMGNTSYSLCASNNHGLVSDTLSYSISVITDAAPLIATIQLQDSLDPDRLYFKGRIKDDYGFSKLLFKIEIDNTADTSRHLSQQQQIGLSNLLSQEFYYSTDLGEISLLPGDRVRYFFEVYDNDGIHGPKASRSQQYETKIPTADELDNLLQQGSSEARQKAESSMADLQRLQQEINEMMRKFVDKKELSWQDKKQLEELAKKQQEVRSQLEQMQKQLNQNSQLEQKYRQQSEKIVEKQRELDRLMNEVLNDEMRQMMDEIQQIMQEADKKKVQQQLEQLKMRNDDLEKQLDQNIELMQRLELEKKVEETVQKAEKLAEEQRKLANETNTAKTAEQRSEALKKQQEIDKQYQQLKNDIEQIQQQYRQIDPQADFKVDQQLQQSIEQNQKQAANQLNKGNNKEASKQQQKAADQLDQLSEQLAQSQLDMEQQNLAEDSETVRRILKNLVQLSFNQESLISDLAKTYIQDPRYQTIITQQNKIKSDFSNVEDSLRAMAHRQLSVASAIGKELDAADLGVAKSLASLLEFNQAFYGNAHNTSGAQPMQYTMTSFNNLALLLAESLDQMQNSMRQNQQKKNNGSCKNKGMQCKSGSSSNPGKGKPSAKSLRQMQEELNRQLQALKKQQGSQQGNSGRPRAGQQGQLSEEFARMAAQQEQIRRLMQEYGNELKQQSGGNAQLAREIDELTRQMEQTETDLVNRTISTQTINRQQQILTRLLEHEKAEMQREKEQRRESHEAHDIYQPSPADLQRFDRLQQKNSDLFRALPPTLSTYYKNKTNDYFFKSSE